MCECCGTERDIYLPLMATVNKAKMMNETEIYLNVSMDDAPLEYMPGQFVEVSVAGIGEAPISISSSPTQKGGFEMVIRRIGNVTNKIHMLTKGDKLGIRGPYGNGNYPTEEAKGKDIVFICGGIGLAPQRSFINYILDNRDDYGELTVLVGTKEYQQRLYKDEIEKWNQRDDITILETIDVAHEQWKSDVGVVTTLIPKIESDLQSAMVMVCGPPIMYKFVLMALEEYSTPHDQIFVNLERKMKCGVGKCGHCQINQFYTCVDGPVFRYSDVRSAPEAI